MSKTVRIAIDVMGGDNGPSVTVPGAEIAALRRPDTEYLLVGDEKQITPIAAKQSRIKRAKILHTDVAVRMDDKPSQALRKGRKTSSMWLAIEAVKKGEADVAISAGNTGALMAMSLFCLKPLAGIDRPAIAAIWPSIRGESIVLDVGASIGSDAKQLVDNAVMGAAMARVVFDLDRPTVGLLNVGVEEMKGVEEVREAGQILRDMNSPHFDYRGFVEGDDISKGTVDVIVTEGFTGNIALKTAEGTARQIGEYLRAAMSRTLSAKIGYLLARGAFRVLRDKMDPSRVNGGLFLGLNGLVVKSHGSTDAAGFASAIEIGYDVVRHNLLKGITEGMRREVPVTPEALKELQQ